MSVENALESGKFDIKNLTLAVNKAKVPRRRLAELGLFEESGITTLTADVEFKDGKIILVTEKNRGDAGDTLEDEDRTIHTLRAVHLPVSGRILADALQDRRAFGEPIGNGTGGEQFDKVVEDWAKRSRASLETTLEMLRFGALRGKVIGASGKVIVDLFTLFGLDPAANTDLIDFTAPKGVRNQLAASLRASKENQAGVPATKYRAFCSAAFMDALMEDEGFAKAYARYQDGKAFREDVRGGIYWDGVTWEENTERMPNGSLFVAEGEALLVPEDNAGLLVTHFSPANYAETVGTEGLPMYGASEPLPFNKGLDVEAQSNPIVAVTSPYAVRVLKVAPSAADAIAARMAEADAANAAATKKAAANAAAATKKAAAE